MALSPSDVHVPHELTDYVHALAVWQPPSSVVNVLGLFGVVCLIYIIAWLLNKPHHVGMGDKEMTGHFRNTRVRYFVGEGITDFVEDGVADNKITRAESIDIYNKIGRAFGLVDLLPKKKPRLKLTRGEQEHLKEVIKERSPHLVTKNNVVHLEKRLGQMLKRA